MSEALRAGPFGFYASLEARRAASFYPVMCGVTGGLETVVSALLSVDGASPMTALGNDLLVLLAGSIDATESMPAGSSMPGPPGFVSTSRWARR